MGRHGVGSSARRAADGGERAAAARPWAMLPRLRGSVAVFTALVALGGLTQLGAVPFDDRGIAAGALLGAIAWAGLMVLTRGRWWADLLAVLPLGAGALAVDHWWVLFPLVHVVIFQRALYGRVLRAYGGALLVGGAPLALALIDAGTQLRWSHTVLLPSLLASTWLLRQVRLLAEQMERGARRERRLLVASRQLAVAEDQAAVNDIVVHAALDLLEQPDSRTTLWEERGDQWVAVAAVGHGRVRSVAKLRLPPEMQRRAATGEPWVLSPAEATDLQVRLGLEVRYRGFVYVPLPRPSGPQAVLMVSCRGHPDPSLADTLRRFAQEIALAEERTRLLTELADREARLASVLEGSADIIAQLDADGRFTMVNQATVRAHGYHPEDLVGRSVFDLIPQQDRGEVLRTTFAGDLDAGVHLAHRLYDVWGRVRHVESRISRTHPDSEDYILNTRDVTDRKELEAEIVYRAHHDALTGLANRAAFTERLDMALARSRRVHVPVGLLMLDLDGFKPVNDTHGHQAGDAVLAEVARRLQDETRETDTAARVGGDEFAVILEDAADETEVAALARRLADAIMAPIPLPSGPEVRVTASVGMARSRPDEDADVLLREADQRLYATKRARRRARVLAGRRGSSAPV